MEQFRDHVKEVENIVKAVGDGATASKINFTRNKLPFVLSFIIHWNVLQFVEAMTPITLIYERMMFWGLVWFVVFLSFV
jgi:hypothetical protein